MKTYTLKHIVVGIMLVILTLGFCVVGTGAARPDHMDKPMGQHDFMPDGETPVFFDIKDAIMFGNVYDHLSELYPDSEHVRKLGDVAALRKEQLEFQYHKFQQKQIEIV